MALLTLAAIVAQLVHSVEQAQVAGGSIPALLLNFFSFFTIASNVGAVVVLAVGAILSFSHPGDDPVWFAGLRAAVVTYMITTGAVYNLLLRNVSLPQGQTVPWSNEVLHVIAPICMLLDWLFAPGRAPLRRRVV